MFLLSQWLTFKLFGITYLVGKIKFTLLSQVHWLSECFFFPVFFSRKDVSPHLTAENLQLGVTSEITQEVLTKWRVGG